MSEQVITSIHNKIGIVELNRPHRLNALTIHFSRLIVQALEAFNNNEQVAVVVITGIGRNFCAGTDLKNEEGLNTFVALKEYNAIVRSIVNHSKIVVAAINVYISSIWLC
eukprot:TRINITY_DN1464_c0_g2_i2.p1 TRINITY_DN1464_c0_g2~~TRINITY_DN1464_c0_g2_i2.p1  ORF type:complete len:110 (-),score=12.39 TRINITY_DN1464_c0_g2_i2:559-888(-)